MLRKLRAALIISALWVLCWVPFGLALERALVSILFPEPPMHSPYIGVSVWAIWGALSGLCFATVLGFRERGHTASNLSTLRVLSWGALGSALVPLLYEVYWFARSSNLPGPGSLVWIMVLVNVGISALLGTVCAAITQALVRVAQRARANESPGAA